MKKVLILAAALSYSPLGLFADTAAERLDESARILHEVMGTPDKGIPQDLMNKAACVVIVPSLKKGAFVVGAEYGKGFATCQRRRRRRYGLGCTRGRQGGRR